MQYSIKNVSLLRSPWLGLPNHPLSPNKTGCVHLQKHLGGSTQPPCYPSYPFQKLRLFPEAVELVYPTTLLPQHFRSCVPSQKLLDWCTQHPSYPSRGISEVVSLPRRSLIGCLAWDLLEKKTGDFMPKGKKAFLLFLSLFLTFEIRCQRERHHMRYSSVSSPAVILSLLLSARDMFDVFLLFRLF